LPVAFPNLAFPFQAGVPTTPTALWLLLIGLYVAFLLVGLWVHQDARLRGMKGRVWFAITFLLPIFGLVAYLIFRRERPG